jgi:hypothetical protein
MFKPMAGLDLFAVADNGYSPFQLVFLRPFGPTACTGSAYVSLEVCLANDHVAHGTWSHPTSDMMATDVGLCDVVWRMRTRLDFLRGSVVSLKVSGTVE